MLQYNKSILVLGGVLLLLLLLLIQNCRQSWQEIGLYSSLDTRMDTLSGADSLLRKQQLLLQKLSFSARELGGKTLEVDSHLTFGTYLDSLCRKHGLTIVSLPQESLENTGSFTISSERFHLSGRFHDIVQVLYQLEYEDRIGSIGTSQLKTQTIRNGRNKQTILLADIELKRLHHSAQP